MNEKDQILLMNEKDQILLMNEEKLDPLQHTPVRLEGLIQSNLVWVLQVILLTRIVDESHLERMCGAHVNRLVTVSINGIK